MSEAAKVISFNGTPLPIPKGEAIPEIVEILEGMLTQAKTGEIRALAVSIVVHDCTDCPLLINKFHANTGCASDLESALMRLVRRYSAWLDT